MTASVQVLVSLEAEQDSCFAQARESSDSPAEQDVIASLLLRAKREAGLVVDYGPVAATVDLALADLRQALADEARAQLLEPPPDKSKKSK